METEDIDAWYEAEKDRIFEEYTKELEDNKGDAEEKFRKDMDTLKKEYEKKYEQLEKKDKKKAVDNPFKAEKPSANFLSKIKDIFK